MEITQHVDVLVIFVGSFLGSVKASVEFDSDKKCLPRLLDIILGVFCGTALTFHFGNELSVWLSGLMALVAGASGAVVIEVALQMLPSMVKTAIKAWAKKLAQ